MVKTKSIRMNLKIIFILESENLHYFGPFNIFKFYIFLGVAQYSLLVKGYFKWSYDVNTE